MDAEYCSKCGLLHDPNDGDCLGCKLTKEIKLGKKLMKILKDSNSTPQGSTHLYNLHPTYQQMKCVYAYIEGGEVEAIIIKLKNLGYMI